ncbi:MAG TPA: SRPBCC family protein [Pseudonocardiaceae bacterium]|nr:SRPBCC family protein [Pseudonocardiaceae bacterium]
MTIVQPTISRSVEIAADPRAVWSMVTDLPRMDRFSPENIGGRWLPPATGPAVGARFRGTNRNGVKEWWTRARVVACEPGRRFMFDVRTPFGVRVSRWCYEITPTPAGCRLSEHWFRVGNVIVRRFLGPRVTGRADRPGFNATSIEHTLAAVKRHAESTNGGARSDRHTT